MKIVSGLNIDSIELMEPKESKVFFKDLEEKNMVTTPTIRVDSELHKSLKRIAFKEKVCLKTIVIKLLETFVEQFNANNVVDTKQQPGMDQDEISYK